MRTVWTEISQCVRLSEIGDKQCYNVLTVNLPLFDHALFFDCFGHFGVGTTWPSTPGTLPAMTEPLFFFSFFAAQTVVNVHADDDVIETLRVMPRSLQLQWAQMERAATSSLLEDPSRGPPATFSYIGSTAQVDDGCVVRPVPALARAEQRPQLLTVSEFLFQVCLEQAFAQGNCPVSCSAVVLHFPIISGYLSSAKYPHCAV